MPTKQTEKSDNETALTHTDKPTPARVTLTDLLHLPPSEQRDRWINSLVDAEVARQQYQMDMTLAIDFAKSGVLEDAQSAALCFLKIRTGRDIGLSATESIRSIYFVNGRPDLMTDIFAAKLRGHGYNWDIEWTEQERVNGKPGKITTRCTLWLTKWNIKSNSYEPVVHASGPNKGQPISESFGDEEASAAEVFDRKQGKKIPLLERANYVSWKRDMYFARCLSRLKRRYIPHVLTGIISSEERWDNDPKQIEASSEAIKPKDRDAIIQQYKDMINESETTKETEE